MPLIQTIVHAPLFIKGKGGEYVLSYLAVTVEALVEDAKKIIADKDGDIHALLGLYSDTLINDQIGKAKEMLASGTATMLP